MSSISCNLLFWVLSHIVMPPTSKKLEGHIASGSFVCPCIHALCFLMNFWTLHAKILKVHIWIPHDKIAETYFFFAYQD